MGVSFVSRASFGRALLAGVGYRRSAARASKLAKCARESQFFDLGSAEAEDVTQDVLRVFA